MTRYTPRPKGLPSLERLTADQLRSEVLRLCGNFDRLRYDAEQLKIANAGLRDALIAALETYAPSYLHRGSGRHEPERMPDPDWVTQATAALSSAEGVS